MVYLNFFIFLFKFISYCLPIPLMVWTYKKYKHWSHLGLGIADLFFLVSTVIAYALEHTSNTAIIETGWIFANIFLYCAFWVIILSLLIAQFDKLPGYSHLVTLLTGALIGLVLNPENVEIYYEANSISASYSVLVNICGGLILIVFILSAFNPLVKKLLSKKVEFKKKQYLLILVAYLIIVFWVVSLFLTSIELIRGIRRVALALGMLLWSVALYLDPLTIVISKAKIQKILILTKNGLPVFSYDFEKGETMDSNSDLLAGILSAIKSGIEQILTSGKSLKTMAFEDSIMNFVNGEHVVLLLLSEQTISSNTQLIANVFLENFESKYKNLLEENIIEIKQMEEIADLLRGVIDSVQL